MENIWEGIFLKEKGKSIFSKKSRTITFTIETQEERQNIINSAIKDMEKGGYSLLSYSTREE